MGTTICNCRIANVQYVEVKFRPIGDGRTLGVYRDITELKQRQGEAERARDAIEKLQRLMNFVLEGMTDGVKLFDADRRIIYANSAADRLLGIESGDSQIGLIADDILRRRLELGHDVVEDGKLVSFEERLDRLVHPTGARYESATPSGYHVEYSFRPVGDGLKLGVYRDITELRRQQAESERARQAAEAASRAKSTFLATMSHEIRTPMNGVIGTAELLEREPLTPHQQRLIGTIQASATALLGVIDDVLDFSKIEAERLELNVAPFSLAALMKDGVETLAAQAAQKGLAIVSGVATEVPDWLAGDAKRVRQILLNLIGNAIKFTDAGDIRINARLERVADGRARVALSVADTGIGMKAEQIERLFQPFSQGDGSTTRRYGGTGLGLSIVERLAKMMGSEVRVESTPGVGSTFTVMLDLAVASAPAEPKPERDVVQATTAAAGVVLAIDDSEINLQVLVGQLGALGVTADTATDGIEGLAKWRSRPYALVLTDVHMPGMDGLEMTRRIRADEPAAGSGRHTPIVAVTANALKGNEEHVLSAGLDAYLTKPVTLARLRETVERWIGVSKPVPPAGLLRPSGGSPIDRAALALMIPGGEDAISGLLRDFAFSGTNLVAEIRDAAADRETLARLAHKLKGTAQAVAATRLAELAARLEASRNPADIFDVEAEWYRVIGDIAN